MEFEYSRLWKALPKEGVATDDIRVHVLDANYVAMKHRAVPFLTRNMTVREIIDPQLSGFPLYAHGMYAVFEAAAMAVADDSPERARALRRKSMFVVFPTVHPDGLPDGAGPFVSGDHFSFFVSPRTDESERLHFHLTEYVPWGPGQQGDTRHRRNNLPLCFNLGANLQEFKRVRLCPDLRPDRLAKPLHTLLQLGTVQTQTGGSKTRKAGRAKADAYRATRGERGRAFEDLWFELPLHSMTFVVVTVDAGYDVTVVIRDRLAHPDEHVLQRACAFRSAAADLGTLKQRAADIMATWSWTDFQDPEEPM